MSLEEKKCQSIENKRVHSNNNYDLSSVQLLGTGMNTNLDFNNTRSYKSPTLNTFNSLVSPFLDNELCLNSSNNIEDNICNLNVNINDNINSSLKTIEPFKIEDELIFYNDLGY